MAQVTAYAVGRIIIGIGAILIAGALVIGVIYLLAHHGEQVRHDQATKLAAQELQQKQEADVAAKAAAAKTPVATHAGEISDNGASTTTPSTATKTVAITTPAPAAQLPTTGISDTIAPMAILAIVTFAAVSYVTSRRQLNRL